MKNYEIINFINHYCTNEEEWDDYHSIFDRDIYTPYEIFYETIYL